MCEIRVGGSANTGANINSGDSLPLLAYTLNHDLEEIFLVVAA